MSSRLALAVTALLLPTIAGPPPATAASDVEGPNILVRVEPSTKDRFVALRDSGWDVIHIHGNTFDILVDDAQLAELLASGDRVTIEDDDVYANLREIKARRGTLIGNYTTYAEMAARMQDRASTYPSICSVQSIGTSHEGRDIWAMKISDNVGTDEGEPGVLYMGTYHARELIAVEIPLALADSLLMNYGSDARYTDWVNEREIWFIPIVNVDGHVYVENNDTNWRKNRRNNGGGSFGVDINRNHDWQWGHDNNGSSGTPSSLTYRGPSPASEPEVQAIQNFVNAHSNLRFSISYHSYGDLWLWGPGYKPGLSPDQDLFGEYGAQATATNGYLPGNPAVGAIYITNGDVNDWLYNSPSHPRIYGMTPEVGSAFYPPESQIPSLVAENIEPAWIALDNADRPERLAPPGQPTLSAIPDSPNGDALVQWSAPTTADTMPVEYELVMKEGPTVATDGFESAGSAIFTNGWTRSTARKFAGSWSLYSGAGDNLNRIAYAQHDYVVQPGDAFSFRAWYSIETDWDYAYAVCSTDAGRTWENLAGTNTTMSDPNGNNADNGITGSANWVQMTFDLAAYVGLPVRLGVRYFTDGGVQNEGIYIDDVFPRQDWTTETVLSSSIVGTSYPVTGLADGDYWFTVRGHDAEGDWGYYSAEQKLVVSASTAVAELGDGTSLRLARATPNPFAASTEIRFSLPTASDHSLVVYDVSGRRVRTLSRGLAAAGAHSVEWDGRNDAGRSVPSGVYFFRLVSPAGERQQRTVLTR